MYTAIGTLLEFYTFPANTSLFNCLGIAMTECESTYIIWRNGPYIGGHLAFFFQIEFQTRL